MRKTAVVFLVLLLGFWIASARSAAANSALAIDACAALTIRVTSTLDTDPAQPMHVRSSDGSVFVEASSSGAADKWSLGGISFRLARAGDSTPDRARISVLSPFSRYALNFYHSGKWLCSRNLSILSLHATSDLASTNHAFVMLDGTPWGALNIGTLRLDAANTISSAFVSFDGQRILLSGRLQYNDLITSNIVTLSGDVTSAFALRIAPHPARSGGRSTLATSPSIYLVLAKNANLYRHQPWFLKLTGDKFCVYDQSIYDELSCINTATYELRFFARTVLGDHLPPISLQESSDGKSLVGTYQKTLISRGSNPVNITINKVALDTTNGTLILGDDGSISSGSSVPVVVNGIAFAQSKEDWLVKVGIRPSPAPATKPAPPSTPSPSLTPSSILPTPAMPTTSPVIEVSQATLTIPPENVTAPISTSSPPQPPSPATLQLENVNGTVNAYLMHNVSLPIVFANATASGVTYENLDNPVRWTFNFAGAGISDPAYSGTFLGYPYDNCPKGSQPPKGAVKSAIPPLCFEIHLDKKQDESDVARAFLSIGDLGPSAADPKERFAVDDVLVVLPSPSPQPSSPPAMASNSNATSATPTASVLLTHAQAVAAAGGNPFVIRFGAGEMAVSQMDLHLYKPAPSASPSPVPSPRQTTSVVPLKNGAGATVVAKPTSQPLVPVYGGFDNIVKVDRLNQLYCTDVYIAGDITIADLQIGAAGSQTSGLIPRFGFGERCKILSFSGYLPLQITPQSSLTVTTLTFIESTNIDATQHFFYLNMAGSYSTGNVTIVLDQIGFRTFDPADNSSHCLSDLKEFTISHQEGFCGIAQPNYQLTALSTASQNLPAIESALSGAVSGVAAFFLGRAR